MEVNDLFSQRKLRKIEVDKEKSKSSLRVAANKLNESRELFNSNFYNQALLSAYTSMFHSARALLYYEGVQEKGHYAVYIYLRDIHNKDIPSSLVESFLNHQKERKEILYGFEYEADKDSAENSILDAEEFLSKIKELLHELL